MEEYRILVVDDEPADSRLAVDVLSQNNMARFECDVVHSLEAAKAAIQEREPDAILLDLHLPPTAGLETLDQARRIAPSLPIVVLTGTVNMTNGLEAIAHGADDYVAKGDAATLVLERALAFAIRRRQHFPPNGPRAATPDEHL